MRFNPPPGWPRPPAGWTPPPDWQPDPSWPAPPPGWRLWVEDAQVTGAADSTGAAWLMGGGAAVFVGAFLPWISGATSYLYQVNGGAKSSTAFLGVVFIGGGAAIRYFSAPGRSRRPAVRALAISLLVLVSFGILGYGGFAVAGMVGYQDQSDLLGTVTVTFSPNIGLVMVFLGCLAVGWGAIKSLPRASAQWSTPR